jgi:hypothetical protein
MQSSRYKHLHLTRLAMPLLLMSALPMWSCGIDRRPHWQEKNFGQIDQGVSVADQPQTGSDQTSPETQPTLPELPTNQLLSHYGFQGYFNLDTVRRIFRGSDEINGEISSGGLLDDMLSTLLGLVLGQNTRETLSLLIRQNGAGRNAVTQTANTEGGDNLSAIKGDESQSGIQYLDWVLGDNERSAACPRPFVCIDRMVWSPNEGQTTTYCYRDPLTQQRVAIPYSANPHFSAESFASFIGSGIKSKPIRVTSHPGNVSCDQANLDTNRSQLVVYKLSLGHLHDQRSPNFIRKAVHRRLVADAEVIIDYSLYNPTLKQPYLPKEGPYIDQLTRLNSRMKFFTSDKEHVMVKIERTVQSPLKLEASQLTEIIRSNYGDWAASAAALIFPADGDTQGAQMVYTFEFCTHLAVVRQPFNHCTGQVQP